MKILQQHNMNNCKPVSTPMVKDFQVCEKEEIIEAPYGELIGSLTYLSMMTRPDITFATSYLSRYLDKPTASLWQAAKRILRYLKGTIELRH